MAINKVIYGGDVLIDLTADTVTVDKILRGFKAHDKSGAIITGECDFDVDSRDATAAVAEILFGRTAYVNGKKLTGTMPNNGAASRNLVTKTEQYAIPIGFHDGSGKVGIDPTEQAKLIPGNIKSGVKILGIVGDCRPASAVTAQPKTVIPSIVAQTILPDEDIDYLSQVVVSAIPYVESQNSAGGITVTIAGV